MPDDKPTSYYYSPLTRILLRQKGSDEYRKIYEALPPELLAKLETRLMEEGHKKVVDIYKHNTREQTDRAAYATSKEVAIFPLHDRFLDRNASTYSIDYVEFVAQVLPLHTPPLKELERIHADFNARVAAGKTRQQATEEMVGQENEAIAKMRAATQLNDRYDEILDFLFTREWEHRRMEKKPLPEKEMPQPAEMKLQGLQLFMDNHHLPLPAKSLATARRLSTGRSA